ncbi:MAG: signal recognition particle-docking protein FtsY [Armatimonadota bacterium]|nr:signal recognition particle-docking protein FtsY [Armatimonadota bacterium]MDR7435134.1 signal recognition particle-docking protein FtsY [Armatimonadota bacterium]
MREGRWVDRLRASLARTRQAFLGRLNELLARPVDAAFYEDLEALLLEADLGVATTQLLLQRLRSQGDRKTPEAIRESLKSELRKLLGSPSPLLLDPPPAVVLALGVNGSGKTTTLAKLAHRLKAEGKSVLLAAADTFRAAAIEQLEVWGKRVGCEVIRHQPGGDPAAVVFDAAQATKARRLDVLLVDTAGRLHTKVNLIEELKKIDRVLTRELPGAPVERLLVLDATTGQNAIVQARIFTQAVGVTGIALAKLDGTAKGGAVVAISHELGLPVKLVGTGEGLEDLEAFDPEAFVEALLAP